MPSYQNWGQNGRHSRLPLTPPEFPGAYLTPISAMQDNSWSQQQWQPRRSLSNREYNDRYQAPPSYSSHRSLAGQLSGLGHQSQDYYQQPIPSYQYAPGTATTLPPIHVSDPMDHFPAHYGHQETKPTEEKPTGGVAQHLDYDMDTMSSFVAEMSHKLVSPETVPSSQFRKYVSQILSSTRLPSSTIMLGLFYLNERMKIINERGPAASSSGTVYRMLTTCLLLGSKFLDDNTFQNRSWAEVSSIPVHELNMLELQWLTDFNWEIHGMMYDNDSGFFMWVKTWHNYEEKAQVAKVKQQQQKLTPIETNIARPHPVQHQPLLSPEGPIPPQYQQGSQYDTRWVRPYISEYSPPSAPHSGSSTPDYYAPWSYASAPSYSRQSYHSNHASAYVGQGNQLPAYAPAYSYPHNHHYFGHSGYPMQTVVG